MATVSIRSTYALDPDTVERIARLAEKWAVSRSEALRRAVRSASQSLPGDRLAALDALQSAAGLSARSGEEWIREVRRERRSSPPGRKP